MTTSEVICERENCPCCTQAKQDAEREHIRTGSLISTLQLTVNQLNIEINKLKGNKYESDTN